VYDHFIVGDDEDDEDADARQARRGMFRTSRAKESADDDEMAPGVEESESSYVELDWDDPTWNPFQCHCAYGPAQDRTRRAEIQRRFRKHISSTTITMRPKRRFGPRASTTKRSLLFCTTI
jgi:hypothetical protein